eukprot:Hpha_TRINITY_DN16702_c7_g1::TRINITY_DN16702_c7_g1_i2::g.76582::m.76582
MMQELGKKNISTNNMKNSGWQRQKKKKRKNNTKSGKYKIGCPPPLRCPPSPLPPPGVLSLSFFFRGVPKCMFERFQRGKCKMDGKSILSLCLPPSLSLSPL